MECVAQDNMLIATVLVANGDAAVNVGRNNKNNFQKVYYLEIFGLVMVARQT